MRNITVAVLSVLFVLAGCGGGENSGQQASQAGATSTSTSPVQKLTLSDNEEKLGNYLLDKDINKFFNGEDSNIGVFFPRYSPDEISDDFKQNEVRALSKYKGETFAIVGKISDIQADLEDKPFVVFSTKNRFDLNAPQARFDERDQPKVVDLNKGDTIQLVCIGNGEFGGTPILGACVFDSTFKMLVTNDIFTAARDGKASSAEEANSTEKMAASLLLSVKTASEYTDNFKSCAPNYDIKCLGQSYKDIPKEKFNEIFARNAKEYGFKEFYESLTNPVSAPK